MKNELSVGRIAEENSKLINSQPLKQLAKRANDAHGKVASAARQGLLCANEAGQALLEANRICPMGEWLRWLTANFEGSRWTARRYMAFATECNRLGGLDGAALHHIAPHEAGCVLKKLLVLPSGKKKPKTKGGCQPALPSAISASALGPPATCTAHAAEAATPSAPPALCENTGTERFRRLLRLFEELLAGLQGVMHDDDCQDAPFAELLLMELRPTFAELREFVENREELNRW